MTHHDLADELQATDEQLDTLRQFGVDDARLEAMSLVEAEALIAQLQDERAAGGAQT